MIPPNVPALSIRQPWAFAILNLGKDVENRTWSTEFRGRVLVHGSKTCTQQEYLDAKEFILDAIEPKYRGVGIVFPGWKNMQQGGIIGEAEIVDCVSASSSPWFVGPFGFVLRNVKPLPFTPCAGRLGFFYPKV